MRTPEGLQRARKARWQHGYYSAEAKATRAEGRAPIRPREWPSQNRRTSGSSPGNQVARLPALSKVRAPLDRDRAAPARPKPTREAEGGLPFAALAISEEVWHRLGAFGRPAP